MDLHYKQEVTVGTLVLVGVLLFIGGSMWLGGKTFSRAPKVHVQFEDAGRLCHDSGARKAERFARDENRVGQCFAFHLGREMHVLTESVVVVAIVVFGDVRQDEP